MRNGTKDRYNIRRFKRLVKYCYFRKSVRRLVEAENASILIMKKVLFLVLCLMKEAKSKYKEEIKLIGLK